MRDKKYQCFNDWCEVPVSGPETYCCINCKQVRRTVEAAGGQADMRRYYNHTVDCIVVNDKLFQKWERVRTREEVKRERARTKKLAKAGLVGARASGEHD